MTLRCRGLLAGLLASVCLAAGAQNLTEIVWDGFSYPNSAGMEENCDAVRYPSCKLLFSEEYQARFANKLLSIVDNQYKFVNMGKTDAGETLHLTIAISLEWSRGGQSASNGSRFDARYMLCSTLLLYRADSSSYRLENAASRCNSENSGGQGSDMDAFLREFVYGRSSKVGVNLEDTWLAEASALISRRQGDFKRIAVKEVELADDGTFAADADQKAKLRLYMAEKFSQELSQALRKPIIPPALSGSGQLSLRFSDNSRKRKINLPIASHSLSLRLLPFQRKVVPTDLTGVELENFFTIVSVSHVDVLGDKFLNNAGFYTKLSRRIFTNRSQNADGKKAPSDMDKLAQRATENVNMELLDVITKELGRQIAQPEKSWVQERSYKMDPGTAYSGLEKLAKELSK